MVKFNRQLPKKVGYHALISYLRLRHAAGGPDFADEIGYWNGYLRQHPASVINPGSHNGAFPEQLRAIAAEHRSSKKQKPKLLEIGSGPVSILAAAASDNLFDIIAVDPLARAYRFLLRMHHISYPIQPRYGRAEALLKQFGRSSFDVVYSSNALDHAVSPQHCMEQICEVLRPGGFLLLEGFVCEGSKGGWIGLHQHDFFPEDGHLMHADRAGHRSSLSAPLPLDPVSESVCEFENRGIRGFGYELPDEIPDGFNSWQRRGWYTLLFRRR